MKYVWEHQVFSSSCSLSFIFGIPFSILITHLILAMSDKINQDLNFSHILASKCSWYFEANLSLTEVGCMLKGRCRKEGSLQKSRLGLCFLSHFM